MKRKSKARKRIIFAASDEELRKMRACAKRAGLSLSAYLRWSALFFDGATLAPVSLSLPVSPIQAEKEN